MAALSYGRVCHVNIVCRRILIDFFKLFRGADRKPRAREAGPEVSISNDWVGKTSKKTKI